MRMSDDCFLAHLARHPAHLHHGLTSLRRPSMMRIIKARWCAMRRAVLLVLFLVCAVAIALSQQPPVPAALVKIKIRAALFDRDLNLKPVPRLIINLTPKVSGPPQTTQTSLDGV